MRRKIYSWLVVMMMLVAMMPLQAYAVDSVITTSALEGVSAPVAGAVPASAVTPGTEFSGVISWSPSAITFDQNTEYTATITVTPNAGYTLTGVSENFFMVAGATTVTNTTDSGVVTAVFPQTGSLATIATAEIAGVTIPVKDETPVSAIAATDEYTATIAWNPSHDPFKADTVYTATIALTAKPGYTLAGVPENFFTLSGAAVTNATDSGIVTAVFPETEPGPPVLTGATTDSTGNQVILTFNKAMADPSAETISFSVETVGSNYGTNVYYATTCSAVLNSDPTKIDLNLNMPVMRGDIILISYTPGNVTAADTTTLGAFTRQSVSNAIPVVIITNLDGTWKAYDHAAWWGEWGGSSTSLPTGDDYRGVAFNKHIFISGSAVTFYGYGVPQFKDFLFLPNSETASKGFNYDLDLTVTDWHTLEGGGFLFNAEINTDSLGEEYLSGYAVLFTAPDYNTSETYKAKLYQLNNVDVDQLRSSTSYYNYLDDYPGVDLLSTYSVTLPGTLHSIRLETSPIGNTVSMWDGSTQLITNYELPAVYGNGVGLIASYVSHYCSSLSYLTFNNLTIEGIANLWALLAGTQANLTFTAPEGATTVGVEQSTDGVTWTPATLTGPIFTSSTTATVTGLTPFQTYYFRLLITGGTYEGYSAVATAEYVVPPIADLAATTGDGTVNLTFTPPPGAGSLALMQSTDGGLTWIPAVTTSPIGPASTSATITGLINGQLYSFMILIDGTDESNVVNATPGTSAPPPPASHRHRSTTPVVLPEELTPLGAYPGHISFIKGYPDNTVKPEGYVTREEAAAVFYRLLDPAILETISGAAIDFKDVGQNRWSASEIKTLVNGSILMGYPDGTFKPGKSITRAELAVMAAKFDKLSAINDNKFSDINKHWAAGLINAAAQKGWVTGYPDGTFQPNQFINRAELVNLVNAMLGRNVTTENTLPETKQFPDLTSEKWYYKTMQEAINMHLFELTTDKVEKWTKID